MRLGVFRASRKAADSRLGMTLVNREQIDFGADEVERKRSSKRLDPIINFQRVKVIARLAITGE